MTPSKIAIQEAIYDRLTAALSVRVGTDPGIPGVEIGDDDESQVGENTNGVHTDVTHTLRARALTETNAKETGRDAVKALTQRTSRLEPQGFNVLDARLTGSDMQRTRRVDGPDYFEEIIQVTFRVTR